MSVVLGIGADEETLFRSIVARAASRFRVAGRSAYYFSRGKLTGDPVFAALLREGRFASRARIVDLGCGMGVFPALLAAAEEFGASAAEWPQAWAPPATAWTLHGIDMRNSAIETGRRALSDLGQRVQLSVGDLRTAPLPACDVAVLLDVMHYIDHAAQQALLARIHAALAPRGTLLMRIADAARNWPLRLSLASDWCVLLARGAPPSRFWCRPLKEWIALLEAVGFTVTAQPMSRGTPFANVMLTASRQ